MKKHVKDFFLRGMMFSGLGPIVLGIVYFILSLTLDDFSLSGREVLIGIISTYVIAFVQAGASVFNEVESWSAAKSAFFHLMSIYVVYTISYLVNSWIPFSLSVLLVYTAIFIAIYAIIWTVVFICVKTTQKRLNSNLKK